MTPADECVRWEKPLSILAQPSEKCLLLLNVVSCRATGLFTEPPPPAPPAPPLSGHTPIALHLAMIALLSQREQFIIVFIYAFIDWNVGSCDL